MRKSLTDAFVEMEEGEVLRIAGVMLDGGEDPMEVVGACKDALEIVGRRFERGDAFLPELMMAGEMMEQISAMTKPRIKNQAPATRSGKVLLGTVEGDIHDIGKNIVAFLLDAHGFEVIDVGVDVPPRIFVDKIRETGAKVVGLSGLLTLAFDSMKATVEAIAAAGLRDSAKIMLGGSPVDERTRAYAGADAWGKDAVEAVSLAKKWLAVS